MYIYVLIVIRSILSKGLHISCAHVVSWIQTCLVRAQWTLMSKNRDRTSTEVNAIIQQHLMVPKVPLSLPVWQIYVSVMKCLLTGLCGPRSALLNQAC